MKDPFEYYTPSVFVVCSPFQAMCAIAAIRQLHIEDYKLIVISGKNDNRRPQMINLLELFQMNYEEQIVNKVRIWYNRFLSMMHKKEGFQRLFLGDFRNNVEFYFGAKFIQDNVHIVYLDDGAATISLLNNTTFNKQKRREMKILRMIAGRRRLTLWKNLFTIYTGIFSPRYNIKELSLNLITDQKSYSEKKCVYVIGTNIVNYCEPKKISKDRFISKQKDLMTVLKHKYPNTPIVYIPHGRDKSEYAFQICEELGCEFRRTRLPIELEFTTYSYEPIAIYGFTSSALFNLKKMFSHTKVVNVLYIPDDQDNDAYLSYERISKYYEINGIELVKVSL